MENSLYKVCTKCKGIKFVQDFYIRKDNTIKEIRRRSSCKRCESLRKSRSYKKNPHIFYERNKRWANNNPEKVREKQKRYRLKHPDVTKANNKKFKLLNPLYSRNYAANLKKEMIEAYGGKCTCCGEINHYFLSIDHIYNDGNKEKFEGTGLYSDLKKRDWPKDRYQLLCMNCNFGKRLNNGVCPHGKTEDK